MRPSRLSEKMGLLFTAPSQDPKAFSSFLLGILSSSHHESLKAQKAITELFVKYNIYFAGLSRRIYSSPNNSSDEKDFAILVSEIGSMSFESTNLHWRTQFVEILDNLKEKPDVGTLLLQLSRVQFSIARFLGRARRVLSLVTVSLQPLTVIQTFLPSLPHPQSKLVIVFVPSPTLISSGPIWVPSNPTDWRFLIT